MGLVNQLGSFSHEISIAAGPLRDLLKTKNEYTWTKSHYKAFNDVKKSLTQPPILSHFDTSKPTAMHTNASRLNDLG